MSNPNVPAAVRQTHAAQWEMHFAKLAAFQQQFGHFEVPTPWTEDQPLANWVRNQRQAYAINQLKPDRQQRLEQIGFNWRCGPRVVVSWEARLAQLVAFKARFGHCDVDWQWAEDPLFGHWVFYQRRLWRKARLNSEQIRRLEELGFKWQLPDSQPGHTPSRPSVSRELAALNLRWEKQLATWRNG